MTLKSTVEGRVLYRLAEEGEVLGGRRQGPHPREPRRCVHGDLPAGSGRREGKTGADARIVLDVAPEYAARPEGDLCRPGGPVHAQGSRDPERARQADVPREAERPAPSASCPSSSGSRPAFAASATSGSTTRPPGPNGSTAPSRGPPPPAAAAAGKPDERQRRRRPTGPGPRPETPAPDLDEGDAMASPSMGISTPPDRDTVPRGIGPRRLRTLMGPPAPSTAWISTFPPAAWSA